MASARLTPEQLKVKMETIRDDVTADPTSKHFAKDSAEVDPDIAGADADPSAVATRKAASIGGDPEDVPLIDIQETVAWLRQGQLDLSSTAPFKARLALLETHANSPAANKAYLQEALEVKSAFGHDDQECTDRFNVLVDEDPATIDQKRLHRLTERWRKTSP